MTSTRTMVVRERPSDDSPRHPTIRPSGFDMLVERRSANAHQLERELRASKIPDDMFDEHPEVKRLRALVAERERRVQQMGPHHRTRIHKRIDQLEGEIKEKEWAFKNAALDDVFDEPMTFERSFAIGEDIRRLHSAIHASRVALDALNEQINTLTSQQHDEFRAAREELFTLLKTLRKL